jgi:energy-coupling factor transporter ATP-binding protein EcfA2
MPSSSRLAVGSIEVKGLFGLYNYDIPGSEPDKDTKTILILYGDNGSGKTTILRLLFHAVTTETGGGHKSFIARTKFEKVRFEFTDGHRISLVRSKGSLVGSFTMEVESPKESKPDRFGFEADQELRVQVDTAALAEYLNRISEWAPTLYLLSDDRQVHVSEPRREGPSLHRRRASVARPSFRMESELSHLARSSEQPDPEQIAIQLLENSLRYAHETIRIQVMSAASKGESDTQAIYKGIIEDLATADTSRGRPEKGLTKKELAVRLDAVQTQQVGLHALGFAPRFDAAPFLKVLSHPKPGKSKTVNRILKLYLSGLDAKQKSLSSIQGQVNTVLGRMNSFLVDKRVEFDIYHGFRVLSREEKPLQPSMLSSGERHLLLLFCNTLAALYDKSIFMIDEPEISLNIKWQRNLVESLVECARGSPVQYIFATHSVELIAKHLSHVVKLESREHSK